MTLGTQISADDINIEIRHASGATLTWNDPAMRIIQSGSTSTFQFPGETVSVAAMQNQNAVRVISNSNTIGKIATNGAGTIIAAECGDGNGSLGSYGGSLYRSTNGTTWEKINDRFAFASTAVNPYFCSGVWYLNGRFIASWDNGFVYTSTDAGITWTGAKYITSGFTSMDWNGTIYLATTGGSTVYYSSNLTSWFSWSDTGFKTWYNIKWTGTYWVGFGNFTPRYAADGTAFANFATVSGMSTNWGSHVAYSGSNYLTYFYNNSSAFPMYTSSDGVNWTQVASANPGSGSLNKAIYWSGNFYVGDTTGKIYKSTTGASWSTAWTNTEGNGIIDFAISGSLLLGCGFFGTVVYTTDGTTWSAARGGNINMFISDIIYANSIFVATAKNASGNGPGTSGAIYSSTDGETWTARVTGISSGANGVCWSGSQFVVMLASGSIYTSSNGTTWASASTNLSTTSRYYGSIAFGNSVYVTVVNNGTNNEWYYSSNATSWTSATMPSVRTTTFNRVRFSNGYFIGMRSSSTPFVYSTNGSSLTDGVTNLGSFYDVTYNGTYWIAVGGSTPWAFCVGSGVPSTWTTKSFPWPTSYSVVAITTTTYHGTNYQINYETTSSTYSNKPAMVAADFYGAATNGTKIVMGGTAIISYTPP